MASTTGSRVLNAIWRSACFFLLLHSGSLVHGVAPPQLGLPQLTSLDIEICLLGDSISIRFMINIGYHTHFLIILFFLIPPFILWPVASIKARAASAVPVSGMVLITWCSLFNCVCSLSLTSCPEISSTVGPTSYLSSQHRTPLTAWHTVDTVFSEIQRICSSI